MGDVACSGVFFIVKRDMLCSVPFSIIKDWKFLQADINNPYTEVFWLWVYFLNVFPSPFVVIFACLELGQFVRSQEGETKRKAAVSHLGDDASDNFDFSYQESENMNIWPQML